MICMTEERFLELQKQRNELQAQMREVEASLQAARDEGDVSDNAGVDVSTATLSRIKAQLYEIINQIDEAEVVTGEISTTEVSEFSTVTIEDLVNGGELTIQLAQEGQDKPPMIISVESLLGRELLGKQVGQVITYRNKRMEMERFRIKHIG